MAENEQNGEARESEADAAGVNFAIRKIYVKDLSFEAPGAPEIFTEQWTPDVDLQLNTTARQVGEHDYEVSLTVTATVKVAETTAFLAEAVQAGIFTIGGVADEQLGAMLGAYCPNVLFPYAREVISDVSVRGGFPQLVLAPVNFDALFQQHQQEQTAT